MQSRWRSKREGDIREGHAQSYPSSLYTRYFLPLSYFEVVI